MPNKNQLIRKIVRRLLWGAAILILVIVLGLGMLNIFSSKPDLLGVSKGQLAPCPDSPNCVSTQSGDDQQRMEPIRFTADVQEVHEKIVQVLKSFPRTKVIIEDEYYIHAEFRSFLFRFVDDVEFYIDADNKLIHFRSASRIGHSDLGVNRKRMDQFRKRFSADVD